MRSFFFNDTATTEIYPLSLHDALPIPYERHETATAKYHEAERERNLAQGAWSHAHGLIQSRQDRIREVNREIRERSEEHTSELQSRQYLVCRLLLEKKKHNNR